MRCSIRALFVDSDCGVRLASSAQASLELATGAKFDASKLAQLARIRDFAFVRQLRAPSDFRD